jgi:hypothetical protein
MKQIIIAVLIWLIFCHGQSIASTSSIPFTHNPTYGTWKKIIGSKPNDPLYVSFQKNYGLPDSNGTFFDSAKVAVMEPPKEHANFSSLLDFMTPKPFTGSTSLRMENDPLTFQDITIGGATGKAIRGTGRLIYNNNLYPPTNMLAKGYIFETQKGVIEILIQIRSVKGDILKLEQDVDEMVGSFRFGLPDDIALMKLMKTYKPPTKPVNIPKKEKSCPYIWIYTFVGFFGASFLAYSILRALKKDKKVKQSIKKQKKKKDK